jgi:hypothetical protein
MHAQDSDMRALIYIETVGIPTSEANEVSDPNDCGRKEGKEGIKF